MRYIALPRGINVTGSNMIKMPELRAEFESLGFGNVVTYINSGNIAFDSKKASETSLIKRIAPVFEKLGGKPIEVMIREQAVIKRIIDANPFAGLFERHTQMHVLFLREPLPAEKVELMKNTDFGDERFEAIGHEIYCYLPLGVAESVFSKKAPLDKRPRVTYTARNWRTVLKLSEL